LKQNLVETDVFLERYLPCQILNIIKDVNDDVIGDYNDRKKYLTQLDAEFKRVEESIKMGEITDKTKSTGYGGKQQP
jgi:hypothetical protein